MHKIVLCVIGPTGVHKRCKWRRNDENMSKRANMGVVDKW